MPRNKQKADSEINTVLRASKSNKYINKQKTRLLIQPSINHITNPLFLSKKNT